MKKTLLFAALLAAPLAHAQWQAPFDDEVSRLEQDIDRLRADEDVIEFARAEFDHAEEFVTNLAEDPPHLVEPEDVEKAQDLIAHAERMADERAGLAAERPIVVLEDDEEAWDEARDARRSAAQARRDADEERERALAAQLEAENERNENARLRAELGEAQTRVTDRGVVLTLGDVLFAVGKADLKPGATRTLDKLVGAMKRDRDTTVTIEGHTDSTGKHAYNVGLSQRRADAVRRYLAARGIAAARIQSRGLGPDYPVATNATEAGRQQNRRVELLVQNEAFDE